MVRYSRTGSLHGGRIFEMIAHKNNATKQLNTSMLLRNSSTNENRYLLNVVTVTDHYSPTCLWSWDYTVEEDESELAQASTSHSPPSDLHPWPISKPPLRSTCLSVIYVCNFSLTCTILPQKVAHILLHRAFLVTFELCATRFPLVLLHLVQIHVPR